MSFPNKDKRQQCWDARDNFWQCLDKHAPEYSTTSGEEPPTPCKQLRKLFEDSCPGQWTKHFDRKRTYEIFKEKMQQGYDPVENKK